MNFTLGIILNWNSCTLLFWSWHRWNQVKHQLIVDFEIWNSHRVIIIKTTADLLENLWNGTWNQTTIFVVLHTTAHSKSLTSPGLSIHHHSSIESINYRPNDVSCTAIEDVVLAGIMQDLIKFESPWLLLIVDHTSMLILRNIHIYMLQWVGYIHNHNSLH